MCSRQAIGRNDYHLLSNSDLFCVYSVSVTIFQTFSCHDVGSHDEKEEYMTADYSVSCASERYSFAFWWAVAMVFVYPLGKLATFMGDLLFE